MLHTCHYANRFTLTRPIKKSHFPCKWDVPSSAREVASSRENSWCGETSALLPARSASTPADDLIEHLVKAELALHWRVVDLKQKRRLNTAASSAAPARVSTAVRKQPTDVRAVILS